MTSGSQEAKVRTSTRLTSSARKTASKKTVGDFLYPQNIIDELHSRKRTVEIAIEAAAPSELPRSTSSSPVSSETDVSGTSLIQKDITPPMSLAPTPSAIDTESAAPDVVMLASTPKGNEYRNFLSFRKTHSDSSHVERLQRQIAQEVANGTRQIENLG